MSRAHNRPRGVMVENLDHTKLSEACLEAVIGPLSYSSNALLRGADGSAVVLSYEGVCESKTIPGRVYLDTQNVEWQTLPLDIVEACRTGEETDLADHIRTFGDRLDSNHYLWFRYAGGVRA